MLYLTKPRPHAHRRMNADTNCNCNGNLCYGGLMNGALGQVGDIATSRSYWLLALTAIAVIGPFMWPVQWSGNEINYFDLSYRFAQPEAFTDSHAVFDDSKGRIVSFLLIGNVITLAGFEAAKTIFALTLWLLSALGVAAIARDFGLRVAELALPLLIFCQSAQGILGNEWMFYTIEAKVFAYAAVFLAITSALNGRWILAMIALAVATYMHFLVGGFWAVALVLLHLLKTGRVWQSARLAIGFFLLILPLFFVLIRERIGVEVDTSGLDRSLNAIYTELSAHFHVAPLLDGIRHFLKAWLPGTCVHLALLIALVMLRDRFRDQALLIWLIGLNVYVLLALVIYMLDDGRYLLAPFYLLRPAGLICLMSLLALAHMLSELVEQDQRPRLALATCTAVLLLLQPQALGSLAQIVTRYPPHIRLEAALSASERDVLSWIRTNTAPNAAIVVQEAIAGGSILEGDPFPGGMERLSGRGFVVNFKYIPTSKPDVVRWYQLLQARRAFFDGECTKNTALRADYAVIRLRSGTAAADCVTTVFSNNEFLIGRILPEEADRIDPQRP